MNKGRLAHFIGLLGGSSPNLFQMGGVSSSGLAVALGCRGFSFKFREVFGGADVPHAIRRFSKPRGLLALEAAAVSPGAFLSRFLFSFLFRGRRRLAVPALFFVCVLSVCLSSTWRFSRVLSLHAWTVSFAISDAIAVLVFCSRRRVRVSPHAVDAR